MERRLRGSRIMAESENIEVTVKTLDSQSRSYTVPAEITVKEFKERISGSVNIPAEKQRLIYQGRVLQDDKRLKEYNVHGKVIHLVERAPPQTTQPQSGGGASPSQPTAGGRGSGPTPHDRNANSYVMVGTFNLPVNLMDTQQIQSEPRVRLVLAQHMLRDVQGIISRLENPPAEELPLLSSTPPAEAPEMMDTSSPEAQAAAGGSSPGESAATSGEGQTAEATSAGASAPQRDGAPSGPNHPSPSEYLEVLSELQRVEGRLQPFLQRYQEILGTATNADYNNNTEGRDEDQRIINLVGEALRLLGNTFVGLSDLRCNLSSATPRHLYVVRPMSHYTSPMVLQQAPIPIQINVGTTVTMTANGSHAAQGAASTEGQPGAGQSAQPPTSDTAQGATESPETASTQTQSQGSQTGHPRVVRITHQTVDPMVTMQVNVQGKWVLSFLLSASLFVCQPGPHGAKHSDLPQLPGTDSKKLNILVDNQSDMIVMSAKHSGLTLAYNWVRYDCILVIRKLPVNRLCHPLSSILVSHTVLSSLLFQRATDNLINGLEEYIRVTLPQRKGFQITAAAGFSLVRRSALSARFYDTVSVYHKLKSFKEKMCFKWWWGGSVLKFIANLEKKNDPTWSEAALEFGRRSGVLISNTVKEQVLSLDCRHYFLFVLFIIIIIIINKNVFCYTLKKGWVGNPFASVGVEEGVDITHTNLEFLREQFNRIATHILNCTDNTFGHRLLTLCNQSLFECLALNLFCLRGEQSALTNVINDRIRRMSADVNPSLVNWLTTMMGMRLQVILEHMPMTEEQIQHYVRRQADRQQEVQEEPMEQQILEQDAEEMQRESSSGSPVPATTAEEVMPSAEQPVSMETERAQQREEPDSEPWAATVPPDWVPIIKQDIQSQRKMKPQGPLSDAYLSGMPAKRRKSSLNRGPRQSLTEASTQLSSCYLWSVLKKKKILSSPWGAQRIQTPYRDQVKSDIQKRIRDDPNYSSQRFPNTHRAFEEES
uniref:BCL2-associated athanogene 6 n=1 Tax=Latimeria chalumnae TaxID=7897 RepID=H3A2A1_LATCH